LVGDIPDVEFILFDKSRGVKAYLQLAKELKGREFDILLHMQVALRASLASLVVNAPIKLGFDLGRSRNGQSFFVNHRIACIEHQHVLDGFLEFPKALGLTEPVLSWDIPIPDAAQTFATNTLPQDKPILAINPCTSNRSRNWRNWSVENYASVIDFAAQNFGVATVLTGGPSKQEIDYAAAITKKALAPCIDLVGKTNLKELLAVLEQATVMISPDTGPAHMANAVDTPVIGLYASSNPYRTGPYNSLDITANKYPEAILDEFGKTVNEVRWGQRVRNPEVMSLIRVEEVKKSLRTVVEENQ